MAVNLDGRSTSRAGGWALSKSNCPADTTLCGKSWCCPNALKCSRLQDQNIANVCCPSAESCHVTFKETGLCADTAWSLWNSTTTEYDDGYFCCEPGQLGLETGNCIDPNDYIATNPSAVLLAPGVTQTAPPVPSISTCDCPASTSSRDTGPIIAAGVLGGVTLALICAVLYLWRRLHLLGNTRTATEPGSSYQMPGPQWSPQQQSAEGTLAYTVMPQAHRDPKLSHHPPAGAMELETGFRNELES